MATTTAPPAPAEASAKGGKKKIIIMAALVVIVAAAAAWFFLLRGGDHASDEPEAPEPGAVVTLDPVTINLDGGHYLKLGLSLQQIAGGHEEVNGAKALDLAISLFSGRQIDQLADAEQREKLREKLTEEVSHAYHDEVYAIYFTEFVWQ